MKILIDLQALQTGSARRGIGRYACSLTLAMINELSDCEIFILLNDSKPKDQDQSLIKIIKEKVGEERIIRFPIAEIANPALHLQNEEVGLSKILRERFIEALAPDVVLVASLIEFDALSTIPNAANRSYFCAVILYDLIPLTDPDHYLGNSVFRAWYEDRLQQLKSADALLSISEHVRLDAIARLKLQGDLIRNISAASNLGNAADHNDKKYHTDTKNISTIKPYILYVGGFDKRKNVESLVACYAKLPTETKATYKLVLAGEISDTRKKQLYKYIKQHHLNNEQVVLYGFIEDEILIQLYKNAHLFVFPSINEGFGLPPLEAMALGIPTIASNCASLPEVVCNPDALFDPADDSDFLKKLQVGINDEAFRARLRARGLEQSLLFSWKNSARIAVEFIHERKTVVMCGHAPRYLSLRDFLEKTWEEQGYKLKKAGTMKLKNVLARGLLSVANMKILNKAMGSAPELQISEAFSFSVPNYSNIDAPYVFSSMLCREQHFHLPLYTYWCRVLGETPRFHRKQWEFVYICQILYERGYLRNDASGVGFGVGKEPLASYFASRGVRVLATDLHFSKAEELGWVSSQQHSDNISSLNERGLCDADSFNDLASFRNVDMNNIPSDIGSYDFCWSSCAFEHLGSIRKGLDFVLNSAKLLKPGGIAVHTTEYNVNSNSKTLDNNPRFVIFRRRDIELLVKELESEGYEVEPIDFSSGEDELERYVALPPYINEPHLRLQLAGEYVSTSLGIIVRAPGGAK